MSDLDVCVKHLSEGSRPAGVYESWTDQSTQLLCEVCVEEKMIAGQSQSDDCVTDDLYSGERASDNMGNVSKEIVDTSQTYSARLELSNHDGWRRIYASMLIRKTIL